MSVTCSAAWQAGQCASQGGRRRARRALRAPAPPACIGAGQAPPEAVWQEKQAWQQSVRTMTGRQKHRLWEPSLSDPAPLLDDVCVILVGTKRPITAGTTARALSCFECLDLRLVAPRCDHLARSGRNASKGAQFLLWRAQQHGTLAEALGDAAFSVACTRWVAGRPNAYRSVAELLAAPEIASMLRGGSLSRPSGSSDGGGAEAGQQAGQQAQQQEQGQQRSKLALVFGREVEGLTAEELYMCDATLSIPIGRIQESMSLSHAVSVVLSRLFEERQAASGFALPQGLTDLAVGYEEQGVER